MGVDGDEERGHEGACTGRGPRCVGSAMKKIAARLFANTPRSPLQTAANSKTRETERARRSCPGEVVLVSINAGELELVSVEEHVGII